MPSTGMPSKQAASSFHVFPGSVNAEWTSLQPSIVLVLGWMDAPLPLLAKYVDGHRSLFPATTIVLVESRSSFLWTSSVEYERSLQPVVDILLDSVYGIENAHRQDNGLLVHAMSNAGGVQLMTLAGIIGRKLRGRGDPNITPSAITMAFIIDSTPGTNDYESLMTTFTVAIKSPIIKGAVRLPLTLIYIAYYLINNKLFNNPLVLPQLHKHLEQRRLFPGCNDEAPRLYVYSDVDSMVPSASVERHLSVLAAGKIPFVAEKYIGSQHVSHVKKDSTRYWGAVAVAWRKALHQRELMESRSKGKL